MTKQEPLRIGFVGGGGIAHRHADALARTGSAVVTDVVDLDESRVRWLTSEGASFRRRPEELVGAVDAVYVLTPPRVRRDTIAVLAGAGIPIFSEKPLAATLEDAAAIAEVVRESPVPFMTGFMRRWHTPNRVFRDLVRSGAIGEPVQFFRQRIGRLDVPAGDWRTTPAQLCGVTVESASHDIDLLRWIGGDIVAATGHVDETRPDLPGFDETMGATLRFASGASAVLQVSWQSRVERNVLGVIGTLGTAVLEGSGLWTSSTLTVATADGTTTRAFSPDEADEDGYGGQAEGFVRLVRGEQVDHADAEDGLATVEISTRILRSSAV
ncbi:Gfo/Idh/MocA family protein [Microbacterium ulmi]|uniref:Gfo/Idh/MocA family oxidoreductase n=1 Tax=Microbacterium ulmi TaxID=179095 RepID=A0A7Y2PZX3_9MICO|nr:Gfo/Idh/MocA family oxidoreductase [Microbacterium ulmi]NII69267.1 myo-inositol 2-dehydrogenase/D-chiro-inositol 1-dehydrogenase [Microbacterium ulmi]NNH04946.1 Gfo/Idh/MocA family oxidoreductase [Microbacterium ulmi]